MAFFKFRKSSPPRQDAPGVRSEAAVPVETVESLRRRALYRLIGAAVLVLIAIIGFPMLFDTQPRPVVQAPIIVPDRNATPPLAQPASASAHTVSAPVLPAASLPSGAAGLAAGEEIIVAPADGQSASGAIAPATSSAAAVSQAEQNARAKQQAAKRAAQKRKADLSKRQRDQAADTARARALLEGSAPATSATQRSDQHVTAHDPGAHAQAGRYVIQIGAFADAQAAQAARQKADGAGVNAYTQAVTTSAGARIRVRVGPFANRDEAQRTLAKLKQAGLPGSIVTP